MNEEKDFKVLDKTAHSLKGLRNLPRDHFKQNIGID